MRHFPLLALLLAAAAAPLGAQDSALTPPAPLTSPASGPSAGERMRNLEAARLAQQNGLPSFAIPLYRTALAADLPAAERNQITLALTTALLDAGDIDEAETALNTLSPPHDSAWNLRAGLVAAQQGRMAQARQHLESIRRDGLSPADVGWWYFLQGMLADQSGDTDRASDFYQQAEDAAVSSLQRTRFELARYEVQLRQGPGTRIDLDAARQSAENNRGTRIGYNLNLVYAVSLNAAGQKQPAIDVLQQQLRSLPSTEREALDDTRLELGLIAGVDRDAGRTALGDLLSSGSNPDLQRIALMLLARSPQGTDFRRRLDDLIGRTDPHPILEDLLLMRAQVALAAKDRAGYDQADKDASDLLTRFPASDLKAPALGIRASAAWDKGLYLTAARYATEARAATRDAAAGARLGLLEAEAYFRAEDFRSAANAYEAVLQDRPAGVPAGDLMFQRVQSELEATQLDSSDPDTATALGQLLDRLAQDPDFDVVNRWHAEWNLARRLQVAGFSQEAYDRVNRLLAKGSSSAALPPTLRARVAWLQAQLAFQVGKPDEAIRLADGIPALLTGLDPALVREIRSTTMLLRAQAQMRLGKEPDALETLASLRKDYKDADAAARSYLVEAEYYTNTERIADAQNRYRSLADEYPDSPYAPLALYQAALLDERLGKYEEANNRLDEIGKRYPSSEYVFSARMRQGDVQREMNKFGAAQVTYEFLINRYPNNPGIYAAEIALADTHSAQATGDAVHAEKAAQIYERLRDLAGAPIDLRVEAGYKLGNLRSDQGRTAEAEEIWWRDVVTAFLNDPAQAARLGANGRYWMGKTLLDLADLLQSEGRRDEARKAWTLILDTKLEGAEAEARSNLALPAADAARGQP